MLKLSLLIASAAAFQPRATPKVQPQTVRQFGMLDGLFKKSEADVTEKVYFDISIGRERGQRKLARKGHGRRLPLPDLDGGPRACDARGCRRHRRRAAGRER